MKRRTFVAALVALWLPKWRLFEEAGPTLHTATFTLSEEELRYLVHGPTEQMVRETIEALAHDINKAIFEHVSGTLWRVTTRDGMPNQPHEKEGV